MSYTNLLGNFDESSWLKITEKLGWILRRSRSKTLSWGDLKSNVEPYCYNQQLLSKLSMIMHPMSHTSRLSLKTANPRAFIREISLSGYSAINRFTRGIFWAMSLYRLTTGSKPLLLVPSTTTCLKYLQLSTRSPKHYCKGMLNTFVTASTKNYSKL
jgi:hypothetical protein